MRIIRLFATLMAVVVLLGVWAGTALGQQQFQLVTGKAFDAAVPKDFYLEGSAIPTEKRNATLVLLPGGKRALFAPIDTTGYSSDVATKYVGMIITEGEVSICGQKVGVGSYGMGWVRPARGAEGAGTFKLYDQAGAKLMECPSPRDADLKQPRPMQVTVKLDGTARLYFGRHSVELK